MKIQLTNEVNVLDVLMEVYTDHGEDAIVKELLELSCNLPDGSFSLEKKIIAALEKFISENT